MGTVTAFPGCTRPDVFWGEMSPCTHLVHIYGDDSVFLEGLEGFVVGGLRAGEAVIVIATPNHLHSLEERLREQAIDVDAARADNRYLPLLADDILQRFMVNGWPDEARFQAEVGALINRASADGTRKVRAFGEMVALLWGRGHHAATIQLELLWSKLCDSRRFSLFCAYPRDAFAKNAVESIVEICNLHTKTIALPVAHVA